jgi:hypothetical protein
MGPQFTPELRRAPTFAVGIAGMLLAFLHDFFVGLSPRREIAIRPEIPATQFLVFLG